jgi:hypothetical protein
MSESARSTDPQPLAGAPADEASPGSDRLLRFFRWLPLIIIILGGLAAFFFGLSDFISLSAIIEGRSALLDYVASRPTSAMALYCSVYFLAVVFSVPGGSVLTILGGIMFGGLLAGVVTTLVAAAGSLAVFLIARTALGDWTKRRAAQMGPRIAGLAEGFRNNAFYVVVVLRLIPVNALLGVERGAGAVQCPRLGVRRRDGGGPDAVDGELRLLRRRARRDRGRSGNEQSWLRRGAHLSDQLHRPHFRTGADRIGDRAVVAHPGRRPLAGAVAEGKAARGRQPDGSDGDLKRLPIGAMIE